jgi:hypothetical protein
VEVFEGNQLRVDLGRGNDVGDFDKSIDELAASFDNN